MPTYCGGWRPALSMYMYNGACACVCCVCYTAVFNRKRNAVLFKPMKRCSNDGNKTLVDNCSPSYVVKVTDDGW